MPKDYAVKNAKKLQEDPQNYLILNTQRLGYYDLSALKYTISIINVCQTVSGGNAMFKNLEINKELNADIMFEAMKSIIENVPFNEDQLQRYFLFLREYEKFTRALSEVYRDIDDLYIDANIDFMVLGYDKSQINYIHDCDSEKAHVNDYYELQGEFDNGKITVSQFIKKARNILNTIMKEHRIELIRKNKETV